MCGICGYVSSRKITNNEIIEKMNKTLKLRGPDEQNTYIKNNVALGHCRLSIIDPVKGKQPMIKNINNKDYAIVYNGELYNSDDIRKELLIKGYKFNSHCDTEIILTAYIEYGSKCVDLFNGIYAFAIYDEKNDLLFLARDNLGIKPLFYTIYTDKKENKHLIFG